MKKAIIISLLIVSILALDNISDNPDKPVFKEDKHVCIDSTHILCDGKCECDGLGCNQSVIDSLTKVNVMKGDYQIVVSMDSIFIFDNGRKVGSMVLSWDNKIGEIILKDNE